MDKNKAKELSNILLAYSQGKTIQRELNKIDGWQDIKELKGEDIKQATIKLMGEYFNLRIKPEPKLVPFTFEDNLMFRDKWVKTKGSTGMFKIMFYGNTTVVLNNNTITYLELLNRFEFEDQSPCGKYINE